MDQVDALDQAVPAPTLYESAPHWRDDAEERLVEDLLFNRTLNEVYLLIDFISGRPDRSVRALTMPDPETPNAPNAPPRMLSSGEIIERIAEIRYPPGDCRKTNAKNAAFLLLAKDHLAALAHPACGVTVAYSTMFIGAKRHFIQSVRRLLGLRQHNHDGLEPGSRVTLASAAFPGLLAHAMWFRTYRNWFMWFSFVWLLITSLTYWDAALGRSVVQKLDQIWKEYNALVEARPDLLNPHLCPPYKHDEQGQTDPGPPPSDEAQKGWASCTHLWYLEQGRDEAHDELTRVFRCSDTNWSAALHPWCWRWILAGGVEQDSKQVSWLSAVSVLSVFTTYTLPLMFGLLGTLIGAFRSIYHKMRYLELAPRDLALTFLGLPLGAVAGVAVGLFFSPSMVPMRGTGAAAGDLTLTASGLAFLAGYGAQSMFRFIDDLLRKIFPTNGSTAQMGVTHPLAQAGHR